MPLEALLVTLVTVGGFAGWIAYVVRRLETVQTFHQQLLAENATERALYVTAGFECHGTITTLGGAAQSWHNGMLAVTSDGIRIYPSIRNTEDHIRLPAQSIRWFGRPVKYHDRRNELWLHLEQNDTWKFVKLSLWRHPMQMTIRALKTIVSPELVTAYRRRRPYIHFGPVKAQPAEQDIFGAWSLDEPISLYVMPLYVVLLRGQQVLRLLPLDHISQIAALRRLDEPEADGLVSMTLDGEKLSFAVKTYEQAAAAISEAAKRSLEEPVLQKQKKKEDEDEWE